MKPSLKPSGFKTFLQAVMITVLLWALITACTRSVMRTLAEIAIEDRGFAIVALDREPKLPCPSRSWGYLFTATRGGHLYAGGTCVGPFMDRPIVVNAPALT